MSEPARFRAGQRVKYWGQAGGGKYYGTEFIIQWVNVCGCAHQTYAIANTDGYQLSQALEAGLTLVED